VPQTERIAEETEATLEALAIPGFETLGGGANQAGGRAYNERLAISLIRLNGPLPKAELARLTGLSAQTLSLIVRRLEGDGLLTPMPPIKGRIGQPSVPYALRPNGAFSLGVKIGRRSADVMLCDFEGRVRARAHRTYSWPNPSDVLGFIAEAIADMRRSHRADQRYAGVGIAMPFELWKWADEVDAPPAALDGWRTIDVVADIGRRTGLPVYLANDASAACGAELAYSHRGSSIDMLYLFIGSFIGGGVVLDGRVVQGRTGNAGALGSMPVFTDGRRSQLIRHASLITLERSLLAEGKDARDVLDPNSDWSRFGGTLLRWIDRAAETLAQAVVAATATIDFAQVCIDGALPRDVLDRLVSRLQEEVARHDLQGLSSFEIRAGRIGSDARVLGGAMLPLNENFACGQDVLLKATG
jgi:predicted NBD/HSP70 family sugar kinase